MNRVSPKQSTPFYDLFKLIVAVILTIILILLLLREQTGQGMSQGPMPSATLRATPEAPQATASPTQVVSPLPTATSSLPLPTQVFPTSDTSVCPSSPSRIEVGDQVRVRSWLNFRTGPGLGWPINHTNAAGTIMEVIGGPVCTTRNTAGGPKGYLWWNVRMQNGQEGWSAEAPLLDPVYLLEPVP